MHTHVKPACVVEEEEEDIYSRPVQTPFFSLIPDKEEEGSTKFIESIVWPTTTSTPLNTAMEFSTQTQTPQAQIQLDYSSICQQIPPAPSPPPSPTTSYPHTQHPPYYFSKRSQSPSNPTSNTRVLFIPLMPNPVQIICLANSKCRGNRQREKILVL